jgi:hypothetical protein
MNLTMDCPVCTLIYSEYFQDCCYVFIPIFIVGLYVKCEPGSLASIVSGYRLDDRVEVRSPAEAEGFFL